MFSQAYEFLCRFVLPMNDAENEEADKELGLRFRLSEAPDQPEAKPVTNSPTTTLSDAETEAILKRLPPIKLDPANDRFCNSRQVFASSAHGRDDPQPFRPGTSAPPNKICGALGILRYSPGEVPLAPS